MKRLFTILLIIALSVFTTSCGNNKAAEKDSNEQDVFDYSKTVCNKDHVDEFMAVLTKKHHGDQISGFQLYDSDCYNVTPEAVSAQTDIKIFKFSNSFSSFALIDGEAYEICRSFGGHGFVNAVPWDYDNDGNLDLLVASSWGSGLHCSAITIFDTKTKEIILIYSLLSFDAFVAAEPVSALPEGDQNIATDLQVYTANLEYNNNVDADISLIEPKIAGYIDLEDGKPVFIPHPSLENVKDDYAINMSGIPALNNDQSSGQ